MSQTVIGTAGHIDHGKTTLVKALTGTNTDRLREEQERGMTIDLGFAFLSKNITIIDVPGHEKFIRNMVAGVTAIDSALLTIAADDGIMPQTREHFDILSILGVPSGVVALNKTDLIDDVEWIDLLEEEIREFLKGSFMEGAPIIRVSGETGEGIEELRETLQNISVKSRGDRDRGFFRLFADRAFSIKGFGTVVTGTVTGGSLTSGADVELLPDIASAKVRGLQSHGTAVDEVTLGDRAAINLSQIDRTVLKRGSQLADKGFLKPSPALGVSFSLLERTTRTVKHQQRVRLHIGTEEVLGRILFVEQGRKRCEAGETATALLRLETAIAAAVEDPFILRFYSPAETIGGGMIIDPSPPTRFKTARLWLESLAGKTEQERMELFFEHSATRPLTLSGWTRRWQASSGKFLAAAQHLRTVRFGNSGAPYITLESAVERQLEQVIEAVTHSLEQRATRRGIPREDLRKSLSFSRPLFDWLIEQLSQSGKIQVESGNVTLSGYSVTLSSEDSAITKKLADILKQSGYTPPLITELVVQSGANGTDIIPLLHILKDKGKALKVSEKLWYHSSVVEELQGNLKAKFGHVGGFDVGQFKELTHTSRKHAIPLLEYLDSQRFTNRHGDRRVFN
ncbi:MAG: selenocysteine-specific translation elongation factor [Candidatus Neomarinimicrobiota bacterium]|nr:selenocysteine-specific translation elongation factor [Candidatus Neomarinimicrobiota bacterium]